MVCLHQIGIFYNKDMKITIENYKTIDHMFPRPCLKNKK